MLVQYRAKANDRFQRRETLQTRRATVRPQATTLTASTAAPPTSPSRTGEPPRSCGLRMSTDTNVLRSTIHNQDDCLAINKGSNIIFQGNTCIGGHGISIVRPLLDAGLSMR